MKRRMVPFLVMVAVATLVPGTDTPRGDPQLYVHHDDSFETAYCWELVYPGGTQPPYYGAYGEAFDLGAGEISAMSYWVTQIGYAINTLVDIYVWDGGVDSPPGDVLAVVPNTPECPTPFWPDVGRCDRDITASVTGDFTVGCWLQWWGGFCNSFVGADLDGPGGHPWTCVAPGLPWPSGWQDPSIVFGPTQSMGIGAWFAPEITALECPTWGSVKSLFR